MAHGYKWYKSMFIASTGLFIMNRIKENNFENAIEYLLKEKIYNNSGPNMPLLANHPVGKVKSHGGKNH